jgi:3-dehydroquinate dehydratase
MNVFVANLIRQIHCEYPDQDLCDFITAIFQHLNLDKVLQFARAVLTSYAPDSVDLEVEERARSLDQLLDATRDRIVASLPEYSEATLDAAWDEFVTAFDEYQSFASNQIDYYYTPATYNQFLTYCQEFLAQLAVSRQAVVKLVHMHKVNVFMTVMLARERQMQVDTTEFAMALASLPSRPLEMIANAMTAIGCVNE